MRPLARWGILPLMAAPVGAWGLGLGDIELQSALNQPFEAEIAITATADEVESLEVSLADQAAFDRYGLFRADFLSSLDFDVVQQPSGRYVIEVTSAEPIVEPFVTMLLEATTARGRVLREYTALLDPPTMLPGSEGPVPVATPEAGASSERVAGGQIQREPASAPAPAPRPAAPARSTPSAPPAQAAERPAESPGTYGPVQRGETLWAIADQFRPSGVSMNRMLVALYRANPDAFDGNMNLLRRGAILRVPGSSELANLSASNANAEVAEQSAAWRNRNSGGSASSAGASAEERQARLRLVPPAEDRAAAGGESASAGEAATASDSGEVAALEDQVDSLQSELEESQRLIELRDQQLADLQSRLAALEDTVNAREAASAAGAAAPVGAGAEAEPAAEAESGAGEALFADETSADTGGAETETENEPVPAPAASTATEPAARTPATPRSPEPTLVSRVLDWLTTPFVWIGLGVAAVLIAGFGYMRRRRAELEDVTGRWETFEAEVEADEAAESGIDHEATARLRRQIDPASLDFVVEETESGETGAFSALDESTLAGLAGEQAEPGETSAVEKADDTLSNQTVMNLDQADPVAEADFHMAYGLYDQAADLMTKALESDPDNRAYKLKLLEVYFVWGNKEAFLETAKGLRADMGETADADWDNVIIMGKQICPDDPLFAGAQAAAGEVDLDLEAGATSGLDFTFDEEAGAAASGQADTAIEDIFAPSDADTDLSLETSGDDADTDLSVETAERESDYKNWREGPEDPEVLKVGATTAAGLDAAFADDDDEADTEEMSPGDAESLETTQESPTIEQPRNLGGEADDDDDEWSVTTMESPTLESPAFEGETVERQGLESAEDEELAEDTAASATFARPSFADIEETSESPTIEQAAFSEGDTNEMPTMEQPSPSGRSGEYTAELELDDLGLNVSDFESLPDDLGDMPAASEAESDTREQPAANLDNEDDSLLSSTGVTQVLHDDEDDSDFEAVGTSVLGDDEQTLMAPGVGDGEARTGDGLDFDVGDTEAAHEGGDTIEQPQLIGVEEEDVFSGSFETPVDLDVGGAAEADEHPTRTAQAAQPDPQTMTEVGTKLDLARAYIDMGDPEGARSILDEVLEEGDSGQRQEAQTLLDSLSA